MTIQETVKGIMDKYGIPATVWKPIMEKESAGNPYARAITTDEHSIGLFQINVVANPGYLGQDLTDPAVNAEIAARDFILPAYTKAKDMFPNDLEEQAVYTYKTGIRPYWTQDLEESFRGIYREVAGGESSSLPLSPADGRLSGGREGSEAPIQLGLWDNLAAKTLTGIGFLVIGVLGFVSVLQLFPAVGNTVTKTAMKVMKGGA